jgi:fatty acyl-CoA reductase
MFKRINDEKPEVLKKIVPVFGDITQINCGLNDNHLQNVMNKTELIFHMAASLKLEATLKSNVEMNMLGTKHVVDMSKNMKKLLSFMHLSTAFCTSDVDGLIYERVYDYKDDPYEILKCYEWMDDSMMQTLQKQLLGPFPNTYIYTKRLSELFMRSEYDSIPGRVCIVRPSIGKFNQNIKRRVFFLFIFFS